MGAIALITGGSRSGKSRFALEYARKLDGNHYFIATSIGFDDEMRIRIAKHQAERGKEFITIEEPYDLYSALDSISSTQPNVILLDCLTVWLGNLFYKYNNDENLVSTTAMDFVNKIESFNHKLILVTNEVGCGIVPENHLARVFRDMMGTINQRVALVAQELYMCVSGIGMKIK